MKSFIDRNPKEKAVEQAFLELAQSDYVTMAPDPADKAFEVAGKLKRHATKLQAAKSRRLIQMTPDRPAP
ncbi:hypothetical protein [Pseudomonas asiatica]